MTTLPQWALTITENTRVIDWEGCVQACNGQPVFAKELLTLLMDDLESALPKLEQHVKNRDFDDLRRELHRMIGGVCYLKVPQLYTALNVFHRKIKKQTAVTQSTLEKDFFGLQHVARRFLDACPTYLKADLCAH